MKISKIYIALLISITFLGISIAYACGFRWMGDEAVIKPFDQAVGNSVIYYPFLHSSDVYGITPDTTYFKEPNKSLGYEEDEIILSEWYHYFNGQISVAELQQIIFNAEQPTYDTITDYLKDNTSPLSDTILNNTLVKAWCCGLKKDAFEFLYFLKQIANTDNNKISNTELIKMGEAGLSKTKDEFIKKRYAYQLVRLFRSSSGIDKSIQLHEQFFENDTTTILKQLSAYVIAGYYYYSDRAMGCIKLADVYMQCPSRRTGCFNDFDIPNDSVWQRALALCTNNDQKANLWFLTGLKNKNAGLTAMHEILQLKPEHNGLEALCSKEIERLQRNVLPQRNTPYPYNTPSYTPEWEITRPTYQKSSLILSGIREVINNQPKIDSAFWFSALGYVYALSNNYKEADEAYSIAKHVKSTDKQLSDQIRRLALVNKINGLSSISPADETSILPELQWLAQYKIKAEYDGYGVSFNSDAYKLCMKKLSELYKNQGDNAKYLLCYAQYDVGFSFRFMPEEKYIKAIISFLENKNLSAYDQFVLRESELNNNEFYELYGTIQISNRNWADAITSFEKISHPEKIRFFNLHSDPFAATFHDLLGYDIYDTQRVVVTNKLKVCKQVIELQNKLMQPGIQTDSIYFKLGNVYFNTTNYGNSWRATCYFRCNSCEFWETYYRREKIENTKFKLYGNYDVDLAHSYFLKAATLTKNKNFAAQNYYMAAKCEQVNYYLSIDFDSENVNGKKRNYQKSFATLQKNYRNTDFYNQLLQECKYFKYYVNTTQ